MKSTEEYAREIAGCVEDCGLKGEEMQIYIKEMIDEIVELSVGEALEVVANDSSLRATVDSKIDSYIENICKMKN